MMVYSFIDEDCGNSTLCCNEMGVLKANLVILILITILIKMILIIIHSYQTFSLG